VRNEFTGSVSGFAIWRFVLAHWATNSLAYAAAVLALEFVD